MAQELVVKEPLTKEMMDAGADLTGRLDSAGMDLSAAFWFYLPDAGRWRLFFATSAVDQLGPRSVYQKVQLVIKTSGTDTKHRPIIGLQDITVLSPKHPVVQLVRKMVKAPAGVNSIRVTHNWVGQTFIEDVYVYRTK